MEYRQLGSSGLRVSAIGLGTNRFGSPKLPQERVTAIMDAAVELGVNFIDTSNSYQGGRSEETLGAAMKGRRDRFVLATKFFFPTGDGPNDRGTSRYHLMNAVEGSLRRLQTDHIDVYYIHRWDPSTPIEETQRALDDLVRQGKVRYIGASDFASWQLARANVVAEFRGWTAFAVLQSHYHMLEREVEREVLPCCRSYGVGFVPYFPLAGGFLTGKYVKGEKPPPGSRGETQPYVQQYMTDRCYDTMARLRSWADARGKGMNELAHGWLLAQPQVCSVISGATRLEQFQDNARTAEWTLDSSELAEVDEILGA